MPANNKKMIAEIVKLNEQIWAKNRSRVADTWPDLDLTVPQLRVLTMLADGPKKMTQIAEVLGIHLSSATTLMDRIIAKKLAERMADPKDRRVVLCKLSSQGQAVLEKFADANRLAIEDLSEFLSDDDLVTVRDALQILLVAIKQKYAAPPEVPAGV